MGLLIAYLTVALLISFICSVSEAVLLSVRPAYISTLEERGVRNAARLRRMKDNPDRPLAAILSLNTIAHTVGAVGTGGEAAILFGSEYVGIFSAVLTLLILVLSEIIPKTVGAVYWRQLAPAVAAVIHWMTVAMMPLVWMSEHITRLMAPSKRMGDFSREEFEAMARMGEREGGIEPRESKIVSNLLRLSRLKVDSIMTPRPVIFALPGSSTVAEYFEAHAHQPFSRIPVYGRNRDDMTGYVLKPDLLTLQARGEGDTPLSARQRPFLSISETVKVSQAFDMLLQQKEHIALVVDEYGSVQGLVTLEDVVETLLGLEIMDEEDTVEDMQALARRRWRERMAALGVDRPDSTES